MQQDRLVNLISSDSEREREKAFAFLYKKSLSTVRNYLIKQGASQDDVEDIFQESMFILYKNVISKTFKGNSSLSTYLFSICKRQWFNRLRFRTRFSTEELTGDHDYMEEIDPYAKISLERVNRVLTELSQGCQELLIDYYYHKMPLKDIKDKIQVGSVQAVKNKKSRCMKKIVAIISEKGLKLEDFSHE